MTTDEIATQEAHLKTLEMGPERWNGESELRKAKAECAEYKSPNQEKTLREWAKDLTHAAKDAGAFDDDEERKFYYEDQPEAWVDHYDDGDTAEETVAEDMSYWTD